MQARFAPCKAIITMPRVLMAPLPKTHTLANVIWPNGEELEAEGDTHGPSGTQVVRDGDVRRKDEAMSCEGRNLVWI